jgi:curved DNA-binding protein
MAVKFRDYYEILNVGRNATQEEIQRAYRKLARKYHPDVSKEKGAEDKFKEIGEAYEVLRDPEKRQRYDQLGANWKAGQEFRPPPGWEAHFGYGPAGGTAGAAGRESFWGGSGGFSDFFEMLFGAQGFRDAFTRADTGQHGRTAWQQRGADQEATIRITLEDAYHGATRTITLQSQSVLPDGRVTTSQRSYDVKIPPGVSPGQKIRLAGQGGEGHGGAPKGDLFLKVEIEPHRRYRLEGHDLYLDLPVTPWEAALGAEVQLTTLSGTVTLKVPAGTHSGQKLRLRGKGMLDPRGRRGDLYAVIAIHVPSTLTPAERSLYEDLKRVSVFDPRAAM